MENQNGLQMEFKLAGSPLGNAQPHLESELSFLLGMQIGDYVQHLHLSAGVQLIAGEHRISATGRSAQFGVEPETNLELELDVRAVNNALMFERASLAFSKPIHLQNVFTTIDEFSVLLADAPAKIKAKTKPNEEAGTKSGSGKSEFLAKASAIVGNNARAGLGKLADTSAWKFIKDAAERVGLNENIEKSREISKALIGKGLSKAEAALDSFVEGIYISGLEITTRQNHLVFSLTGVAAMGSRLRWNFEQIQLPDIVGPTFDSNLSVLLTQFCVDREQGGNMARTILAMVGSIHGQVSAELQFTPIPLEIDAREGRHFHVDLHTQRMLNLLADFEVTRKESRFELDTHVQFSDKIHTPACAHVSLQAGIDALIEFGQAISEKDWIISLLGTGKDITGSVELEQGFELYPEMLKIRIDDDTIRDMIDLVFVLGDMPVVGTIDWGVDSKNGIFHIETFHLDASCHLGIDRESPFSFYGSETQIGHLEGDVQAHLERGTDEKIAIQLKPDVEYDIQSVVEKTALPEFGLDSRRFELGGNGNLRGQLVLHIDNATEALFVIGLDGSSISTVLRNFEFSCDRYRVYSDVPMEANVAVKHAQLSISGLSECIVDVSWHSEESPILSVCERQAKLLLAELLDMTLTVHLSRTGELSFSGGKGIYDQHFFNALIAPNKEQDKLVSLLNERSVCAYLDQIAEAALYPFWPWTRELFARLAVWKTQCEERGILKFKELVHMPTLARALSLLFFGNEDSADEFMPTLNRVLHAQGIDRYKIEELIDRAAPDANIENLGSYLRWIHKLFCPVPYSHPEVTHRKALCDESAYLPEIVMLPSANQLYEADAEKDGLAQRFVTYACGYLPEQIEWILQHRPDFLKDPQDRVRIKKLLDIKRRIFNLEPRERTFFVQDFNIDFFLDLLLSAEHEYEDVLAESTSDSEVSKCFRTWLAPVDLGRLISAGISSRYHGLFVQLNQARLFDYLVSRGKTYALAVMYEIGQHSQRALVGMLMGWLSQPQNLVKTPVDRVKVLSDLTGIEFPRPESYAPWSEKPTGSYIGRIFEVADQIIHSNEPYCAALLRMQSYRFETEDAPSSDDVPKAAAELAEFDAERFQAAVDALQQAIAHADEMTAPMIAQEGTADSRFDEAQAIWQSVVDQVKALKRIHPRVWELPVVNQLYARVYEGLRIAAIEDELNENVDQTRGWFARRLGLATVDEAMALPRDARVRGIVQAIYANDSDMAELLADPLIWFVPRARKSPVDLTIVTAMGVITDGFSGHELSSAFRRLKRDYGVKIARTDTGTVKPIDYNAERIMTEIRKVQGPFVMVGYSQGAANMMYTEFLLRGGTPEMRHLLDNLVSRYFLCSCFNGSAHAICGVEKYRRCMIDGEGILKMVCTRVSKALSSLAFKTVHRFLDMPLITSSLASVECLSHEGLANLSRDAQYQAGVVNFETHGIAKNHVPEALLLMLSHMDAQAKEPNDSQVDIYSSCAYPRFNHNDGVDILKTQNVPSKLLNMHHWSLLREEIALIETTQDIEDFAYRSPNSLYVSPWIEILILFEHVPFLS